MPEEITSTSEQRDKNRFDQIENECVSKPPTEKELMVKLEIVDKEVLKNLTSGAQAEVNVFGFEDSGKEYILKTIGREKGMDQETAQMLIEETKRYHAELRQAGFKVPELHIATTLQPEDEEGWKIAFVEDYVREGQDLKKLFQNPEIPIEEKTQALSEISDLIMNLDSADAQFGVHRTKVAGDFRPANFIKKNDEYVLIDVFAPKIQQEDGQVGSYLKELEAPLTQQAMTFLTADRRGQMGTLLYFAKRHVRNNSELSAQFDIAILEIVEKIPDPDTKVFMENELTTNFEIIGKVYETADIAHLPEEIRQEIEAKSISEKDHRNEQEPTPLPDPSMHHPGEVSQFVESYLTERGETPREINLQIIGVKTLQNPELIERFLQDFELSKKESSYKGETKLFLIDDSWDDDAANKIKEVAERHGVDYYRVRESSGFADKFTQKFAEKVKTYPGLTEQQKKYMFWLERGLLKDRLQAPLVNDLENFRFANPLAELGGIAGTQNFGYLVAAYEAGKRGVPLKEAAITINEDDQRYRTLAQNDQGGIDIEHHDFLAERAAWLKDPKTESTVGRYTGHTGNPISLVRDTLEISGQILSEKNSGKSNTVKYPFW